MRQGSNRRDEIKTAVKQLVNDGWAIFLREVNRKHPDLFANHASATQRQKSDGSVKPTAPGSAEPLHSGYQSWYSKALPLVRHALPDRYEEFTDLYRLPKRKEIRADTFTISDYLQGLSVNRGGQALFDHFAAFCNAFQRQLEILESAVNRLDSILGDIEGVLQGELFDNELAAAEELLTKGHFRAAGALAGVSLEVHLRHVCQQHQVSMGKKDPTIAELNDALKNANVIDVPAWREIQRLGDIRNHCAHKKTRDPKPDEVEDLIRGTRKYVKTLF